FDTADIWLAKNREDIGIISKNFRLPTESFYEGGDLFYSFYPDFDRGSLAYYELPNILKLLKTYRLHEAFSVIPVFDTLIANNDRHCEDRKSTRLNSSHVSISYAVFCLKKKRQ